MQASVKPALGRPPVKVDFAAIEQYFHLPQPEAAKALGISLTSLKLVCRKRGLNKWPYRRVGAGRAYGLDRPESDESAHSSNASLNVTCHPQALDAPATRPPQAVATAQSMSLAELAAHGVHGPAISYPLCLYCRGVLPNGGSQRAQCTCQRSLHAQAQSGLRGVDDSHREFYSLLFATNISE